MARFNTQPITGSVTAGGTLAALTQNAFIQLTGTAPYTVTLPSPVLFPGFNQTFYNATSGVITLTTPAGNFVGAGGSGTATVTVPTTSTINLVSDGVNYVVVGEDGTSLTATTGSFSGNVTINGAGATLSVTPQTVTINPGGSSTIDNVAVGATTRSTGAFTTVAANNAVTFTANTASSTTGTGSLVVTGGVGVSGNINSGGTVAAVALSGPLTGTIQTAAQANITSVGTLTSLAVSGAASASAGSIQVTSTDPTLRLKWTATPVADKNTWEIRSIGNGATPYLQFRTINDANTVFTDRVAFTNDGNVGIGTPTPSGKLHLYQTAGGANQLTLDTSFGSGNAYAINPFITGISNGGLSIRDVTNSVDRLVIQYSTGNVGIGTTNPTSPLTVSAVSGDGVPLLRLTSTSAPGAVNWISTSMNSSLTTVNSTTVHLFGQAQSAANSGYVGFRYAGGAGSDSNYVTLGLYARDYLVNILGNGNVGIGVTGPQARLELNDSASYNSSNYGQIKHLVLSRSENTRYNAYAGFGDQHGANTFGWRFGTVNNSTDYPTLYMVNGKVGIATTAEPVTPLQISSAVSMASGGSVADILSLTDNDGVSNGVTGARIGLTISAQSGIADRRIGIYATANAANFNTPDIAFWASAQGVAYREITRISAANGFLGLGTGANPSAKLHVVVATATSVAGAPSGTSVLVDSNTNNFITVRSTADNATNSGILMQDNNVGGYLLFRNYDSSNAAISDRMFLSGYQGVNISYGTSDGTDVTTRTTSASFDSTGIFWEKRKLVYSQDIAAPTGFVANTWFRLSGYEFNNALDTGGTQPGWIIQIRFANLNPSYGYIHWVTAEIPPLSSNTYTGYQGGYTSSHYGNTSVYGSLVFNSTHHTSANANHDIRLKLDSPSNYDVMNLYIWSNVGNNASYNLTYRVWKI